MGNPENARKDLFLRYTLILLKHPTSLKPPFLVLKIKFFGGHFSS